MKPVFPVAIVKQPIFVSCCCTALPMPLSVLPIYLDRLQYDMIYPGLSHTLSDPLLYWIASAQSYIQLILFILQLLPLRTTCVTQARDLFFIDLHT